MRKLGRTVRTFVRRARADVGSPRAAASDFVDTRLNLTLTNENVLAQPETNPPVPGWRFDRPNQLGVLFFIFQLRHPLHRLRA